MRHYGGHSAAWPLSYADLEPYYTEAEALYLVHGERGEDPTEPWASGPYPHPAVSHEPRIQRLADDFAATGHHPFHLPVGVDLDESDPEAGRCVRCDRFDGFPCLTDGKADAHVCCVRPAAARPNVTLLTHAYVERLETGASGRSVTDVVVMRQGRREVYRGDLVVAACGAVNSAALLLRSASEKHPNGLANGSDQVGRNYMAHINSGVIAISKDPNETRFQKTLGVNDYYWGAEDSSLPLGHIQMLGKSDRNILRAGAPWFAPGLALGYMARHAIDFRLTSEDLPHPDNRVTVDRSGTIHLAKTYHNEEAHRRLLGKLRGLMGSLGCERAIGSRTILDQRIPLAGVAHQCGTVRFGSARAPRGPRRWPHEPARQPRRLDRPRPRGRLRRHRRDDGLQHARGAVARPRPEHGAGAGDREGAGHRRLRLRSRPGPLQRPRALGLRAGASCTASSRSPASRRAAPRSRTAPRSTAQRRSPFRRSRSPRPWCSGPRRRSRSTRSTTPSTRPPPDWPIR